MLVPILVNAIKGLAGIFAIDRVNGDIGVKTAQIYARVAILRAFPLTVLACVVTVIAV